MTATLAPIAPLARALPTPAALDFVAEPVARHGPVLLRQSGGCRGGSAPMCRLRADFIVGDTDVRLGVIGGVPLFREGSRFEYRKHIRLIIDVVPGMGEMFGLDYGIGRRFLT